VQVVGLGRSTKRLAVGVRRIKNLDYADATAAEEIGPARYKILAAAQIGGCAQGARTGRRVCLRSRAEYCKQDGGSKSKGGHLFTLAVRCGWSFQVPVNAGLRFSMKAVRPSV
jgi:hypothetical protein